jgi:hypothetical protein
MATRCTSPDSEDRLLVFFAMAAFAPERIARAMP